MLAIALLLGLGACNLAPPGQRFLVFFQEFSAQVDDPGKATITGAADYAKQNPLMAVHVVGFADPTGVPQANVELSHLRAQVVSDAMVAAGVPVGRITVEAAGPTKFELAAQESRRVVVSVGNP
jgi:outer membrane protein OmpA-like peptidoglycan-associated protein